MRYMPLAEYTITDRFLIVLGVMFLVLALYMIYDLVVGTER